MPCHIVLTDLCFDCAQPDSLRSLASLVKAQQEYHARSAEILAGIVDQIEEAGVAAEVDYRKSRA